MTKGLSPKLKQRAEKLREQMDDMEGLSFRQDEISFRAGNTRRIVTELRLQAILKGSNFKDLRNAINVSPTSFYTPQKYAQLKPQIASMSNAELIAAIDVESSLENIINVSDGPIVGLAFIEYINRLKNIVEDPNSTQTDIDDANQLIQDTYAKIAPFTTKVAQILRQLGEIKSTIKKDEVQFYLDMIEALIEANGNMINDEHRQALKDIIQLLLDSKNNHTSLFNDLANKGSNVTDQDIVDLNMAEVELQNANAALHMLVAFLSPPSTARFWAGVLKGNLMSMRSATIGLLSNIINIGLFRVRNLVHAGISVPFAILHYAGVNVFGLEKYQLFNTSMAWSNVKYALFLDIIQDALVGIAKAIATVSKMMIGKESFRGFLDKSPTANRVFNIIKYGSSGLEGGSPVEIDHSNHIMLSIKNAFTGKGQKTRLNIRGIKMDVANSYKRTNFSKWFKANYPGSDYNALSAKDKKIIQNEYFNDPKAMVPTLGERAGGLGKAFMAWNSEAIFRLVALSDYLPKTYASNVEMTRLAQTLGLDEKQTILFMKDPAKYIEIVQNILSPEVLKFWTDTVAEVTVTKDTGIGVASVALVEGLKTYFPQKLLQKYPELKNNEWFNVAVSTYSLFIDTIFPFVKIPMNFISLVSDYLIPSKPFAKALYFAGLALHNKGTDQADAYALSFVKNISTAVVAMGLRSLAVGLVAIPGMVVIAPGKDDDDEKRKMKSKFSRMSVNIDALKRYFSGEDPSYKQGDRYQGLAAYGVLGMNIYNYATINEKANQEYYDKLKNAPKNVNPKELGLGSPFDIKGAGWFELELKSFESSQNFIDQSWFVGLNSTLQGLTGGDQGADRFVNSYINTLLSFWWGFSSHAQQISDIYREATGKPVFDVALPTNLQDYNNPDYPGDIGDRIWNNIFKKNELIHKALIDIPENSEYIKFDMYGEQMTPVPGNAKNNLEIMLSVSGPMRTARTNLTKEERLYMAVYDNKNKINIPGKTLSLIEPTLKKSEKITVFMTDTNGKKVAETIDVIIKPSDYNKINKMAGDALRDLHTVLLSEQGLLDYEVRGKVISPEDIMSKNWGNTREVANVRNAIALTFSEGNKLLNKFLKPWEMFGENIGEYIDKDIIATIQGVKSLVASKLSEYEVLNPETGQMEMLTNYLVGHPELESKLYNLALESIKLYLKLADESIKNNEEWNKVTDNPEMTIEQEKARKEGNF
jgi:Fe-S cluster biosynthesis and repair protein YggX